MSGSERQRELRRRRARKKKMVILRRKAEKASAGEKTEIAAKIRKLTPGFADILPTMGLE